jgi:Putative transmembrane protein (PGPGW)
VSAGSPSKQNNAPDVSVRMRMALRRSMVIVAAAVLFPVGALMLVLPGPGLLVIGAGLALLASEFPVVRRQLQRAGTIATALRTRLRG